MSLVLHPSIMLHYEAIGVAEVTTMSKLVSMLKVALLLLERGVFLRSTRQIMHKHRASSGVLNSRRDYSNVFLRDWILKITLWEKLHTCARTNFIQFLSDLSRKNIVLQITINNEEKDSWFSGVSTWMFLTCSRIKWSCKMILLHKKSFFITLARMSKCVPLKIRLSLLSLILTSLLSSRP